MMSFMCQKSFHPNSKANQKAVWIAEQKAKQDKQKQIHLQKQYEEEQAYVKAGKMDRSNDPKLSEVSFMYQPPPGYLAMVKSIKKEEEKKEENQEQEAGAQQSALKNAPTEGEYTKEIQVTHKPFGIEVRNVRCLRCGAVGHQSRDRECPLRLQNPNDESNKKAEDPLELMGLRGNGLKGDEKIKMKEHISSIRHGTTEICDKNQTIITSDDEEEIDAQQLVSKLSKKQRKRLLKKIKKNKKKEKKEKKKSGKEEEEEVWEEAKQNEDSPLPERRDRDSRRSDYRDSHHDRDRRRENEIREEWREERRDRRDNQRVDHDHRDSRWHSKDERDNYNRDRSREYDRNEDNRDRRREKGEREQERRDNRRVDHSHRENRDHNDRRIDDNYSERRDHRAAELKRTDLEESSPRKHDRSRERKVSPPYSKEYDRYSRYRDESPQRSRMYKPY